MCVCVCLYIYSDILVEPTLVYVMYNLFVLLIIYYCKKRSSGSILYLVNIV